MLVRTMGSRWTLGWATNHGVRVPHPTLSRLQAADYAGSGVVKAR